MHRATRCASILMAAMLLLSTVPAMAAGPLPQGDLAPGQVMIIRDEYGVPHVFSATPESLWYGVGFAQGQDRLWQADLLRRVGSGTLAELVGPAGVGGDVFARTRWGPAEWRADLLASASPETQLTFQSFAAGMNAWIERATATRRLPLEYRALGLSPRPWTPEDSVAVALFLFALFGESGAEELTHAGHLLELLARFGPAEALEVFQDTHWLNDPDAATTVPAAGPVALPRRRTAPKAKLPPGVGQALQQWNTLQRAWERNLRRVGASRRPASNAVVIGPPMTADGRALLLGGPQMEYFTPQLSHEMGIHSGGFRATGIGIAGLPGVIIGVTDHFAWSFTSGNSDNSDMYVEVLNPHNPSQYLFRGEWVDLDCRLETIHVRGAPDVTQQFCKSVHGPVVASALSRAFALKGAGHGLEIETLAALWAAQHARTMGEIDQAVSGFSPNLNLLVIDSGSNLAYWHLGKIPVRAPGDNPWLPHDGTGSAEWQGFVPWEAMPRALNPEQGWITNWNNKPAPDWDNSRFGFPGWGPVQRVDTLMHLLQGLEPGTVTVETLEEINRLVGWTTDTPSGNSFAVFVPRLLDDMLARVDTSADARLPGIVALLSAWDWLQVDSDGDHLYDSPAVAVFNTWWLTFADRVFADDLGGLFDRVLTGNLAHRLLDDDPALPLRYDYLGGETVEQATTGALIEALDVLTAEYGSADPADWLQPIAEIVWHPLGLGRVPNTIWMNRGTYNQIIQVGPEGTLVGENVVAPGQSGNPFSPHFSDQLDLYATWAYKPMRLTGADLIGHIESILVLTP
jgi:penicillin amidase